jgi:hypothetical protein
MYVFPGKPLNANVEFLLGDSPVSPSIAAYVVTDQAGEVQPSTPITVDPENTFAWVSVPGSVHQLDPGEKYRQLRLEVSYTIQNMVQETHVPYFVVPDLYLDYGPAQVTKLFGSTETDLRSEDIDFYRSYIDLANGSFSDAFLNALNGSDPQLQLAAKQLIFWYTVQLVMPAARLNMLKSVESETSKMQRMGTASNFDSIENMIKARYDYYLAMITTSTSDVGPTLLVLDSPTDAITGEGAG